MYFIKIRCYNTFYNFVDYLLSLVHICTPNNVHLIITIERNYARMAKEHFKKFKNLQQQQQRRAESRERQRKQKNDFEL